MILNKLIILFNFWTNQSDYLILNAICIVQYAVNLVVSSWVPTLAHLEEDTGAYSSD